MKLITVKQSVHMGDTPYPVAVWSGSPLLARRLPYRLRDPLDGHILSSKAPGGVCRAVFIPASCKSPLTFHINTPDKNPIPSGRVQFLAVSTVCTRWKTLASVRVLCIPWSWNLCTPCWVRFFSGLCPENILYQVHDHLSSFLISKTGYSWIFILLWMS